MADCCIVSHCELLLASTAGEWIQRFRSCRVVWLPLEGLAAAAWASLLPIASDAAALALPLLPLLLLDMYWSHLPVC